MRGRLERADSVGSGPEDNKIAIGRDYGDVPPVSGHYKGTLERTMNVKVEIRPLRQ